MQYKNEIEVNYLIEKNNLSTRPRVSFLLDELISAMSPGKSAKFAIRKVAKVNNYTVEFVAKLYYSSLEGQLVHKRPS